eukprot:800710-Amphidinium_carterae.1
MQLVQTTHLLVLWQNEPLLITWIAALLHLAFHHGVGLKVKAPDHSGCAASSPEVLRAMGVSTVSSNSLPDICPGGPRERNAEAESVST